MTPSVFIWVQPVKLKFYLLGQKVRNTIKVPSTSSNRNRLRKGRRSTSPPGASTFRFRYSVCCTDSILSATRYSVCCRDSILSATRYPVDWGDSILSAPTFPFGLAGLSTFAPPGTPETGGTQLFAPQVPYGLVGLSSFGDHGTLGPGSTAGRAYQEMYFVCIVTMAAFNREVKSARNVKTLTCVRTFVYFFLFEK